MSEKVLFATDDTGICYLTLNQPNIHNAFNDHIIAALLDHIEQIEKDPHIRVVILNANGKSFCAGADMNWMRGVASYCYDENLNDAYQLASLMNKLYTLNKPTIAMVQGAAFGGGVGLTACCDIAIASDVASFCLAEVKLGLIPAVISPYVINAIGERQARRYFLTAEIFNAEKARDIGLVHEVVAADDLAQSCLTLAKKMIRNSPAALTACKELITETSRQDINENMLQETAKRIAELRISAEGQEGLHAFLQKRPPSWQG